MAQQISVFVQNKPGRLEKITQVLSQNNINIRAITIQDRVDFGVVKLLVNTPLLAQGVLEKAGFTASLKDVIAVAMSDKPGGLYKIMQFFSAHSINIVDAYGFVIESNKTALLCIEVDRINEIQALLEKEGLRFLSEEELYEL